MQPKDFLSVLAMNPKFIDFTKDEIEEFLTYCKVEEFKKGEIILKEGDKGDKFYILVKGQVGVSKAITEEVVFFLTTLNEGDIFGEMGILASQPRSANVFAKNDAVLLSLDTVAYDLLKRENLLLYGKLNTIFAKVLASRLFKIEERIKLIIKASLINDMV